MWKQRERLYNFNARTAWDNDFFYSLLYPPNLTVDYLDSDTPDSQQYEKDIKYTFNEYGFRCASFDERSDINILTCGCSMTVGVGVDQNETWTEQLKVKIARHTGKSVTAWNIATSGASPDYVVRSLWKVDHLLKPNMTFVYWPPITRLELPNGHNKITQTALGDPWYPKLLVDEDYLHYSFQKNLIFLENYYHQRNSIFYSNPVIETLVQHQMQDDNPFQVNTDARDGMHPGPDWHERVAEYYFQKVYK